MLDLGAGVGGGKVMADEKKPRFEVFEPEPMSREEADRKMEEFFKELEKEFKDVPPEEMKKGAERVLDFIKGKLTWAEIFNIPPQMLKQMAELGYLKYQAGRYDEAERFYKVLTVLDPKNSYFNTMLGFVLRALKRDHEALVQFSEAIKKHPIEVINYTARGEIYLKYGLINEAKVDFEVAATLDPKGEDKWANRARLCLKRIEELERIKKEEAEKKAKGEKKKKKR
jgi:tetratricopeptide (TPR) repeat protein